jgi:adenylosuccinate synthase
VGNLRNLEKTAELLAARVDRANHQLHEMGCTERASLDEHVALMERLAPRLLSHATDTGLIVHRAVREGRSVLLEGAQGALLDVDHGTYPFVTSSNTTAAAAVGAASGPTAIHGVLGVVKAYTTRVGSVRFPTEAEPAASGQLRTLGGARRDHRSSSSLRLATRASYSTPRE